MIKNMLKNIFLICLMAISFEAMAQKPPFPPSNTDPINRYDLFDKTWYFVGMKCPDKIGSEAHYIHWFSTLQLTVSNSNNVNFGTYVKTHRDMRDNPSETGTYTLSSDEVGNVILTLKKSKKGTIARYLIPMVETHHLTLIRIDDTEKCNVTYAIAP
jgi:hypothetical protein